MSKQSYPRMLFPGGDSRLDPRIVRSEDEEAAAAKEGFKVYDPEASAAKRSADTDAPAKKSKK